MNSHSSAGLNSLQQPVEDVTDLIGGAAALEAMVESVKEPSTPTVTLEGVEEEKQDNNVSEEVVTEPEEGVEAMIDRLVDNTVGTGDGLLEVQPVVQPVAEPVAYVQEAHGQKWIKMDAVKGRLQCNGIVQKRKWYCNTAGGGRISESSDTAKTMSRLDYFLAMFPMSQLMHIVTLTNPFLLASKEETTSTGEIIVFFGVVLLGTRFEFSSRAELWSTTSLSKYVPAPMFGTTGMSRKRFDLLWRTIRFSHQPNIRPDDKTSDEYRWMLIDDFVRNFNDHRANNFTPSWLLCADESFSRWYGQGGNWINMGLLMYIAIDRKPENGCEIQDVCCEVSGIMLKIRLVKSPEAETVHGEEGEQIPHGGLILRDLVMPWANSNRVVCADSYFASVATSKALLGIGLRFIGVVKTATKGYPMAYLSRVEMENRGESHAVTSTTEDNRQLNAYVWMDRERRYFISTAMSVARGNDFIRYRWRQVDKAPNAEPERVELRIQQPESTQVYYDSCGKIDQHNRHRQDTLRIEKKFETHRWDMRVNMTLLSVCFVDSWLLYSKATETNETQKQFYTGLAEEMIDNRRSGRERTMAGVGVGTTTVNHHSSSNPSGLHIHVSPTKDYRKDGDGKNTPNRQQGRCKVCMKKTTHVCSECNAQNNNTSAWICHPKSSRSCFTEHITKKHSL